MGGAGAFERHPDRRTERAGSRRGARHAAQPDAAVGRLPGCEARPRDRHLVGSQRPRRRARARRRRRRRRRAFVAVDLLPQRADRHRARAARVPRARREPRRGPRDRRARTRARERRAVRARVGHRAWQRAGLGLAGDHRRTRAGCRPAGCVRRLGAPRAGAHAAAPPLPVARVQRHQRRLADHELRDLRLDLPARAVPADRAGLLGLRRRRAHAPVDAHADVRRTARGRVLGPHRKPSADGHGARDAGDRTRLARKRELAHRRLQQPDRALRDRRHRHGARLRPGLQHDPLERPPQRGGQGKRRQQRDPRGRRRARSRGARERVLAPGQHPQRPGLRRRARTRRSGSARACSPPARCSRWPCRAAGRSPPKARARATRRRDAPALTALVPELSGS